MSTEASTSRADSQSTSLDNQSSISPTFPSPSSHSQHSPTMPRPPSTSSSLHHPSQTSHSTLPHSPEQLRQIAEARNALEASMSNIGSSLDSSLRSRAQNLHDNSKQLDKQQKEVVKATEGLRKENAKLQKLAEEGSRKVKELGNVQNWAEMLERDFLVLEETLRLANDYSDSESSWETESGSENGNGNGNGGGNEGRDGLPKPEATTSEQKDAEQKDAEQKDAEQKDVEPKENEQMDAEQMKTEQDESAQKQSEKKLVDGEGDTYMDDTDPGHEAKDLDKGKAVMTETTSLAVSLVEPQQDGVGGSSTATTGSTSDPSSSSVHTVASGTS